MLNPFSQILDKLDELQHNFATWYLLESDRKRRGVVAVEFQRGIVEGQKDWSPPVQVRFIQLASGEWTYEFRDGKQALFEQSAAARAQRQ